MSLDDLLGRTPIRVVDPRSRYASVETARLTDETGRTVVYLKQRFVPAPESFATRAVIDARPGERPDHLAGRAFGDPQTFWLLADANGVVDPWELPTLGRVRVPGPRFPDRI